jgi:hypothetical protein
VETKVSNIIPRKKETGGEQMKKLLIVVLAAFFVAGLVDTGFAEDRLKVSGSYRARWDIRDNTSDFSDAADDEANSVNQRFRTQFDIAVAEGISARLRTDFTDGTWGHNFTTARGGNRPDRGTSAAIDIDRAYARWSTELFNLIVGLDYLSFGAKPIGIDQQTTGVKVRLKLPVEIDLVYQMIDESGSTNDEGTNGDVNFFGAQAAFKSGAWNAAVFAAGITDDGPGDDSPILIGASGGTSFGPVALTGQLETYFGEVGAADIMGTQLWVEAKYNILPNAHVGIEGLFAMGTDDSSEVQYTGLSDWGSWDPTDRGTLQGYTHFSDINGIRNVTGGSGTMNPVFDPSGNSAGVLGVNIFGEYAIMDPLKVGANFSYLVPQEDGVTTLDSAFSLGLGINYKWMTNTTLNLGYNLVSADVEGIDTDVSQHVIAMIQLKF